MGERVVREVMKCLRQDGWDELTGKGSHVVYRKKGRPNISVPANDNELIRGTYDDIARKAGWK